MTKSKPAPTTVAKAVETPPDTPKAGVTSKQAAAASKQSPSQSKQIPATITQATATSKQTAAVSQPSAAQSKPEAVKTVTPASADGAFWVQIGAFKEAETAQRLVTRLREQGFRAEQTTTSKSGRAPAGVPAENPGDRYHVVVTGASASDVDSKLAVKGLTSETTAGGSVVQPSMPLRDAVALSRDLADAGLTVQVRRVGGPAPVATTPQASQETLHRVRVGAFPDRASATAALKQLEEKGFKPYIPHGNE